ncbi:MULTISPECIES: hypothetical protein [unclassified Cupriavidus]
MIRLRTSSTANIPHPDQMKTPFLTFAALVATLAAATVALSGCSDRGSDTAPPAASAPAADKWLGKWTGPEGTFLLLEGGHGKYDVTVQNLDGPRKFEGKAIGGGIEFERDGVKEDIRATNGAETGMKWLADKKDCLTVRTGEGYCRD